MGGIVYLHACLAQPGEEMFQCRSPGASPSQYMVLGTVCVYVCICVCVCVCVCVFSQPMRRQSAHHATAYDRWPTGYDACVWTTILGAAVVPEVKYRSSSASGRVGQSRMYTAGKAQYSREKARHPATAGSGPAWNSCSVGSGGSAVARIRANSGAVAAVASTCAAPLRRMRSARSASVSS
jgi:hypothetical protein